MEKGNELAVHDDMFSDTRVAMIRDQVAKGAPDYIFAAMIDIAKRRRLDPLAKQISLIRFGGTWTIITTIDGYRALAEQTGQYAGQDAPVFTYADPPTKNKVGKVEPESVTVTVYKLLNGVAFPFSATIYFEEYSTGNNNWLSMPRTMGAKVAESHALRKAFPAVMSGLYTSEEMDQAVEGTAREVTEHVNRSTGEIRQPVPQQPAPRQITARQQPKEKGPHTPPKDVEFYDPEAETDPEGRNKVLQRFILTMQDAGMGDKHRAALTWGAGYHSSAKNVPTPILNQWITAIKAKPDVWKNRAEELMIDMIAEQENLQYDALEEQEDDSEDTPDYWDAEYTEAYE